MVSSTHAELLRLMKWPVTWICVGVWSVMNLFFAYGLNYLTYRGAVSDGKAGLARLLLADMSPAELPSTLIQGMPMFGGAIVLILAALATGSGYGWSTWKTVFAQGPHRLAAMGGTLAALVLVVTGVVLLTFALDVAASLVVTSLESRDIVWPSATDMAEGVAGAFLVMLTFAMAGAWLGVVARSPALSVGLGLVWALVVENLLRGVAALLGPLEVVTDVLPGTAAGSLAGALGATGPGSGAPNGTPGVLTTLAGDSAAALLAGYVVAFVVLTGILVSRRDA
ncbi:MAG: ABC transporter permease [Actinomycetota bacterium]|nr:ABC transporter permease [Actinomycetota bacterium]